MAAFKWQKRKTKTSFKNEGKIKTFAGRQEPREFVSGRPALQEILEADRK